MAGYRHPLDAHRDFENTVVAGVVTGELVDAAKRSVQTLYDVGKELEDRPLLQRLVKLTAFELDNAARGWGTDGEND